MPKPKKLRIFFKKSGFELKKNKIKNEKLVYVL